LGVALGVGVGVVDGVGFGEAVGVADGFAVAPILKPVVITTSKAVDADVVVVTL
jgi:hypothetical protein